MFLVFFNRYSGLLKSAFLGAANSVQTGLLYAHRLAMDHDGDLRLFSRLGILPI